MADHYVKLWGSILSSSIWRQPLVTRVVWITMLAMSDEHGFVGASIDGLARAANVSEEEAQKALEELMAPDTRSRNQDAEGRRVQVVHRGWHIINHDYFKQLRDKEARREYERVRKAEQRSRKRVQDMSGTSPKCPTMSAHESEDASESVDAVPLRPAGPEVLVQPSCRKPSGAEQAEQHALFQALWATSYRRNAKHREKAVTEAAAKLRAAGVDPADLLKLAKRAQSRGKKPAGLFAHWVDVPAEALKELSKR